MKENDNRGGGQGKITRITESKRMLCTVYVLRTFKKEINEICNMVLNDSAGQAA